MKSVERGKGAHQCHLPFRPARREKTRKRRDSPAAKPAIDGKARAAGPAP